MQHTEEMQNSYSSNLFFKRPLMLDLDKKWIDLFKLKAAHEIAALVTIVLFI
jgi:hypothetical protein